jgi:predicted DNA-binding transcriptional regulator YafY
METIMSTCDIPERTAYRYLNTISEANIPIYYDRHQHAYALNRNRSSLATGLDLGDTLLVVLALRLLKRHLNTAYGDEIEKLTSDLLVRQPCSLDDVVDSFEENVRDSAGDPDYSELVSSLMLHTAMQCERQVRLTTTNGFPDNPDVDIQKPRLLFRHNWQIVDAADDNRDTGTYLSDVRKVSIN